MPLSSRTARLATILFLGLAVSACGKNAQISNTVAMKDLEVTDGTTSDAMTDLDGVRTQGTTVVPTDAANAAAPKAAANSGAPVVANDSDAEAVPDQ